MLEDRDYMREPDYYGRRISFTVALLIINAVVFLVECAFSRSFSPGNPFINQYFALSVEGLKHGYVWQLLTYQFMHAGFFHILLNSWAIYFFGQELEHTLGPKHFLALYFSSGVMGGIVQVLLGLAWPAYFGGAVVGASAAAFGLVAAFALFYPQRELTMLIFFVIPITMYAKTLLLVSAVLAVIGIVFPGSSVANGAHLGGMLTGIVYVRQILQGHWPQWKIPSWRRPRSTRKPSRFADAFSDPDDVPADELKDEVDAILDKISARGIQSLTAREREILERARNKMG